jgi:hypothetical protein
METIEPENRKEASMSRFSETEAALLERLRALRAEPEVSINLYDIGVPLVAAGFNQNEIMAVLDALEQDKIVSYVSGNRLLILKDLPNL